MKKENSSQNLCDYVALHTLDALQCCMDTLQCHGGLSAAGTSGRLLSVFYPLKCDAGVFFASPTRAINA